MANGRPLIGYRIYIRKWDLTYLDDAVSCDGFVENHIQNTECIVPLSTLTAEPYNLLKGYSVYIKVAAVNDYGDSV